MPDARIRLPHNVPITPRPLAGLNWNPRAPGGPACSRPSRSGPCATDSNCQPGRMCNATSHVCTATVELPLVRAAYLESCTLQPGELQPNPCSSNLQCNDGYCRCPPGSSYNALASGGAACVADMSLALNESCSSVNNGYKTNYDYWTGGESQSQCASNTTCQPANERCPSCTVPASDEYGRSRWWECTSGCCLSTKCSRCMPCPDGTTYRVVKAGVLAVCQPNNSLDLGSACTSAVQCKGYTKNSTCAGGRCQCSDGKGRLARRPGLPSLAEPHPVHPECRAWCAGTLWEPRADGGAACIAASSVAWMQSCSSDEVCAPGLLCNRGDSGGVCTARGSASLLDGCSDTQHCLAGLRCNTETGMLAPPLLLRHQPCYGSLCQSEGTSPHATAARPGKCINPGTVPVTDKCGEDDDCVSNLKCVNVQGYIIYNDYSDFGNCLCPEGSSYTTLIANGSCVPHMSLRLGAPCVNITGGYAQCATGMGCIDTSCPDGCTGSRSGDAVKGCDRCSGSCQACPPATSYLVSEPGTRGACIADGTTAIGGVCNLDRQCSGAGTRCSDGMCRCSNGERICTFEN